MTLRITAIPISQFLIFLTIVVSASSAVEPQPVKTSDNGATQLKALQDEQVKVLTQLAPGASRTVQERFDSCRRGLRGRKRIVQCLIRRDGRTGAADCRVGEAG